MIGSELSPFSWLDIKNLVAYRVQSLGPDHSGLRTVRRVGHRGCRLSGGENRYVGNASILIVTTQIASMKRLRPRKSARASDSIFVDD